MFTFLSLALAAEPTIPFEKYELDNGLQVILSPDHSVPFVQVNVWYYVGSRNEVVGRTGFAHLFEHLMFQGSEHMNSDYFAPLQKIGAQVNGTTNSDRTNYFEGVPSAYLPLALFLESDRMGWLLPVLDESKLKNQQDVVRNERRQRYESPPYGDVLIRMRAALYPEGHPYHHATIGKHEDIEAAQLSDVTAFFRTWYLPNNASLVICGDFDPTEARALVQQWFGDIPAGPEPGKLKYKKAKLTEEVVERVKDDVPFPKVWLAWHSPALFEKGDAELDLASHALADGKDSRLYRALVYDKKIAKDVSVRQGSSALQSTFVIEAQAAAGHTTDELVAAIDEVLAELRAEGITEEELATSKTSYEVSFYNSLSTIAGKADLLNAYNTWTGDPGAIAEDLARYQDATIKSVNAAIRKWIVADRRYVLHYEPEAK